MNEEKVREALRVLDARGTALAADIMNARKLLEEALAPESRFYKNQPVLVKDADGRWLKRFYSHYVNGISHQCHTGSGLIRASWKDVKPDLDAESIINWIEHDGKWKVVSSKYNEIIVWAGKDAREGDSYALKPGSELSADHEVARYAIIPLPEYL